VNSIICPANFTRITRIIFFLTFRITINENKGIITKNELRTIFTELTGMIHINIVLRASLINNKLITTLKSYVEKVRQFFHFKIDQNIIQLFGIDPLRDTIVKLEGCSRRMILYKQFHAEDCLHELLFSGELVASCLSIQRRNIDSKSL
jgi:hypothetical protein